MFEITFGGGLDGANPSRKVTHGTIESRDMRVGSVVFSTEQGIGILAKSFWDHGILTDVIVLAHGRRPDHLEWYPDQPYCKSTSKLHVMGMDLIDKVDVLLFFETPFCWQLIDYARSKGKRTVLMPMHECMPKVLPAVPDLFLCPSLLEYQIYMKLTLLEHH